MGLQRSLHLGAVGTAISFCRRFPRAVGNGSNNPLHTAPLNQLLRVVYRWHPDFGQDIFITKYKTYIGEAMCYYKRRNTKNQVSAGIPAWMLDEKNCPAGDIREEIIISEDALCSLKRILDEILMAWQVIRFPV